MSTLFISDLHLSQERPAISRIFIDFMQNVAPGSESLYILGDLFEVWLGDDMILPDYQHPIEAIHTLSQQGTSVFIMYGNRDFLMRERFESLTGASIIHEPHIIDLNGIPTLLMHGDTLCTDDTEYQKFRAMVRDPHWQQALLAQTPEQRLALAKQYREISKSATAQKANAIMDVNQAAVLKAMSDNNVTQMIHGHTHRPALHEFQLEDGSMAKRWVLADWYDKGSYLQFDESGDRTVELS